MRLILEDGSVVALPSHPDLRRQVDYLARNILPDRSWARAAPRGERVSVIFEDGTSVPLARHPGVEAQLVSYLAANILPRPR